MRQAMVRLCSKFCKNPDSWIRIRIAQKLVMCSSLLLNTWEEMSSEECQQHASLGCFSPSPGSLHRISRLEGEEGSQCSRVAPLSVWDAASLASSQVVMLPPLCGSTKRSDQVRCSTFRDVLDSLYSKFKANALHLGHFFYKILLHFAWL